MRRARATGLLLAACLAVGATGCSSAQGAAAGAPGPVPAVGTEQVQRVLAAVADVRPDALDARLAGAELEVRRAAFAVREQVPTSPEPGALSGEELLTAVPPAGEWPRWFVSAMQPGAGAVPQLLVLVQDGPRDPYRVAAAATLLPGASLPELAGADGVAEVVAADATGLAVTPAEALTGYADVLTRGAEAPSAATTADDPFQEQVLAEQRAERDGVSEYVEYSVAHAPREGALWSLRTADGGALVIGVLTGKRGFTPRGVGVSQSLPPDLAALAGAATAPDGLDVTTAEVVALSVPPAPAGGAREGGAQEGAAPLALVAAQRGTTGVVVRVR